MKKLLIVVFSLVLINTAFADNSATLRVKVSDSAKNNTYFLCLSGSVGCVNMAASNKGKEFPINTGPVESIYTANTANLQMYTQPLPASCQVAIKKDQTLTVSGQLVIRKSPARTTQSVAYIKDLHCVVV